MFSAQFVRAQVITGLLLANCDPPSPVRTRSYFCLWWKYIFFRPGHSGQDEGAMYDDGKNQGITEAKSVTIFLSLVNNVICFSPIFFPLFLASEIGLSLGLPVPCQKLDKWYKPMNTTSQKRFSLTRGLQMCAEFFLLCILHFTKFNGHVFQMMYMSKGYVFNRHGCLYFLSLCPSNYRLLPDRIKPEV